MNAQTLYVQAKQYVLLTVNDDDSPKTTCKLKSVEKHTKIKLSRPAYNLRFASPMGRPDRVRARILRVF